MAGVSTLPPNIRRVSRKPHTPTPRPNTKLCSSITHFIRYQLPVTHRHSHKSKRLTEITQKHRVTVESILEDPTTKAFYVPLGTIQGNPSAKGVFASHSTDPPQYTQGNRRQRWRPPRLHHRSLLRPFRAAGV